jgi:hypothetical protein
MDRLKFKEEIPEEALVDVVVRPVAGVGGIRST